MIWKRYKQASNITLIIASSNLICIDSKLLVDTTAFSLLFSWKNYLDWFVLDASHDRERKRERRKRKCTNINRTKYIVQYSSPVGWLFHCTYTSVHINSRVEITSFRFSFNWECEILYSWRHNSLYRAIHVSIVQKYFAYEICCI